ncbi:type I pullulanase [Hoylesella timonensis]|uniref:type I pullulanase n=1 Tax=Hoylesella timonensis TaxID=386414 RepID=UPI003C6DA9DD
MRHYQHYIFLLLAFLMPTSKLSLSAKVFNEMVYSPQKTAFKLNAPSTAKHVVLRLYKEGEGGKPTKTVKMKSMGNDVWAKEIKGDLKGMYYTFEVLGYQQHKGGETPGVFAKAVGINGNRGAIIDLQITNPDGWENDKRPALASPSDLVLYEMHVRDYTDSPTSPAVHKGKFVGLAEPKAIAHLKELGVNAVHLLPSFDFASVDEHQTSNANYNWGYDPKNYNVPEGAYSTNAKDPKVRIKEFKQMVQALHKAGIRVILDVVYNHTFDIENSNFQRTYPDYYYRKDAKGKYSNGSGCGNETASEKPLMRQFMLESVKYWINEYHIDGFRFDLMGIHDIATMNAIRQEVDKIDPSIYIYGEGWSAGSCAYPADKLAMKANIQQLPGIAAFSDELRDALRGPFSDDRKGAFLAGIAGEEESIKFGIAGAIAHPQVDMSKVNYSKAAWATEPTQMVSYVSCHDDMCLVDRLKASIPNISTEEIIRLDLLAQTAVFTSQGVPFMLSGEEMLRDKQGVHNSFNSPIEVNRLDWNNLQRYPQVFNYYKGLIALRKQYSAFRMGTAEAVRQHLTFLPTEPCLVGYRLFDAPTNSYIYVLLNANKTEKQVSLPAGAYTVLCYDGVIDVNGTEKLMLDEHADKAIVPAQSALILSINKQ